MNTQFGFKHVQNLLAVAVLTVVAGNVYSASFDGPLVQIGIGGANTSLNTSYGNLSGAPASQTSKGNSLIGKVDAGWSQSMNRYNLAGNLFYIIGNQKSGTNNFNGPFTSNDSLGASANQNFQLKNTWGISIEPGYYLANDTLGYLKFSWLNSQVSMSASSTGYPSSEPWGANGTSSSTVNGAGFGLGLKQMLDQNIYAFAEYQYVQYGTVSNSSTSQSYKPNQNMGLIGIGYKF